MPLCKVGGSLADKQAVRKYLGTWIFFVVMTVDLAGPFPDRCSVANRIVVQIKQLGV